MSDEGIEEAVGILRGGGVVACPTETQFGLLADALSEPAVSRVVAAKQRAQGAAIAVLIPSLESLSKVAYDVPGTGLALVRRWWPGPLTLLVRARPGLPAPLVREGRIGVRVPGPSPALDLVRRFGGPLTATSANLAGQEPAQTAEGVRAALGAAVDLVLEGTALGDLPSTIVDATSVPFRVVRQGAIELGESNA